MPVFNATPGDAGANSFATVEFADDYFALQLHASAWPASSAGADLAEKQKALVSATRWLDSQPFVGFKATDAQSLSWPRSSSDCFDGGFYVGDLFIAAGTIPAKLKEATCGLALFLLQKDPTSFVDEDLSQFSEVQLPGITLKTRPGAVENRLPANVIERLGALVSGGYGTVRLVRK